MNKQQLIDRVAHILVSSINLKLKADGLTIKELSPLSNEGVFDDPQLLRQRRIGWYTFVTLVGKDGKEYDIASSYDIRMKLIETPYPVTQEVWLKLMKDVADAGTLAMHNFFYGDTEYSEWTAEKIKTAVTEQELVD